MPLRARLLAKCIDEMQQSSSCVWQLHMTRTCVCDCVHLVVCGRMAAEEHPVPCHVRTLTRVSAEQAWQWADPETAIEP